MFKLLYIEDFITKVEFKFLISLGRSSIFIVLNFDHSKPWNCQTTRDDDRAPENDTGPQGRSHRKWFECCLVQRWGHFVDLGSRLEVQNVDRSRIRIFIPKVHFLIKLRF